MSLLRIKAMHEIHRVEIRVLTESDIPAAMRLKEAAGWNQTENDWRLLLKLAPEGCFAATLAGEVVGTTTTTVYDDGLAWIGMVLVHPDNRRLGIATKLLETALDYLHPKAGTIKLDATAAGRPVYEKLGFRVESMIERWTRDVEGMTNHASPIRMSSLNVETLDELVVLDRRAFAADRGKIIESLLKLAVAAPVLERAEDGSLIGYALSRNGSNAAYIGPVVMTDSRRIGPLLDKVLGPLREQRVYIDFNTRFRDGLPALRERGFAKQRELIRMSKGDGSKCTSEFVFAIAGPEVG
jgi:GNAT superfamily N-acetyltransferase